MRIALAAAAAAATVLVAGCSSGTAAPSTATTKHQPESAPTSSPAATAAVTGKCVTGTENVTARTFTPLLPSSSSPVNPSDQFAEAYRLTLTDRSSVTAEVTGFSVVVTSNVSAEDDANSQRLTQPAFISPGKSLTWIEAPWGTYDAGQPQAGPYALASTDAEDAWSTCQLVQWN